MTWQTRTVAHSTQIKVKIIHVRPRNELESGWRTGYDQPVGLRFFFDPLKQESRPKIHMPTLLTLTEPASDEAC